MWFHVEFFKHLFNFWQYSYNLMMLSLPSEMNSNIIRISFCWAHWQIITTTHSDLSHLNKMEENIPDLVKFFHHSCKIFKPYKIFGLNFISSRAWRLVRKKMIYFVSPKSISSVNTCRWILTWTRMNSIRIYMRSTKIILFISWWCLVWHVLLTNPY